MAPLIALIHFDFCSKKVIAHFKTDFISGMMYMYMFEQKSVDVFFLSFEWPKSSKAQTVIDDLGVQREFLDQCTSFFHDLRKSIKYGKF